jgi:solute:Na+ symporter, SSS family
MLLWFVIGYWLISVMVGLLAARNIKNAQDFVSAGRYLPFHIATATVFATWFGSETVLGIPAEFLKNGLQSVVSDPFASSLCLVLVGIFFAAPLYRMQLLTIGDYYHHRFGRLAETLISLAIVISYLGWVAAQISALGLIFHTVSDGAISQLAGMWFGSISILVYTLFGGMWAIAITDAMQMVVIIIGLVYIGHNVSNQVGGIMVVINHAQQAGKLQFWPALDIKSIIIFVSASVTMALGSIPQQDIFQRVQSSKTITIAKWSSIVGGVLYFLFAFIPMFLAYAATIMDAKLVAGLIDTNPQLILPTFILQKVPLIAQILFFGALLSAIKSCAAATVLAPSITFTENILKPLLSTMTDQQLLRNMRLVTLVFTCLVTLYAIYSDSSIFKMVENSSEITLVTAFVPLVCGLYWQKANNKGAICAIFLGVATWLGIHTFCREEPLIPAQLAGLLASSFGMVIGSLWQPYKS